LAKENGINQSKLLDELKGLNKENLTGTANEYIINPLIVLIQ